MNAVFLHHAFQKELTQAGAESLGLGGLGVLDVGEALGREVRDFVIDEGVFFRQRVAYCERSLPTIPTTSPA